MALVSTILHIFISVDVSGSDRDIDNIYYALFFHFSFVCYEVTLESFTYRSNFE